jgi:hypothetical protein
MAIPGFTASATVEGNDEDLENGRVPAAHRIAVPGLISKETGLGDVITRITSGFGVPSCDGCRRRARALNSWVSFSPRE